MSEVTRILSSIERGDPRAAERLLPLVYEELRMLAAHRLTHEAPGQTLPAAALVKLRFFAGLTMDQAAQALGIAPRTAARQWAYARAWLYQTLRDDGMPADR